MKWTNIFGGPAGKNEFFIPAGTCVDGPLRSTGSGYIAGEVNGDLDIGQKLTILKGGVVTGHIVAGEIELSGTLRGHVRRCGKITLRDGAVIRGNIVADEIYAEKDTDIEGAIIKSPKPVSLYPVKNEGEATTGTDPEPADHSPSPGNQEAWF